MSIRTVSRNDEFGQVLFGWASQLFRGYIGVRLMSSFRGAGGLLWVDYYGVRIVDYRK